MNKKNWIIGLSLLTSTAVAFPAQAAQVGEEAGTEVTADLPEMVVTATRTSRDKKAVPAATEVISREEIDALGAHTLKDVISLATDVDIIRTTGRNAISIRGFESRFSTILIDGRRISAEIDQNYELERIPLENVERIEIVRGPVSSLYGTDALGGVVNIITKRAEKPSMDVTVDHGAFAGNKGKSDEYSFRYDSGMQDKLGLVLSGSKLDNDSSLKGDGTSYDPFGTRRNVSARFDYQASQTENLSFTADYMDENTNNYAFNQAPIGLVKTDTHDDNNRSEYSLSYTKQQDLDSLFLRAYYSDYYKNSYVHNRMNGKLMNFGQSHHTVPGFEAKLTHAVNQDHILTFGGEYRPETFRGTAVQTGEGNYQVTYEGKTNNGSSTEIDYGAAYVQDEWQISPKLLAVSSLRYDGSNKFDSNVSPKLGLTYSAAPDLRFKANIGNGFRSPTPNQLYINSTTNFNGRNVTLLGNPNLASEKSHSYELAVERDWGKATGKLTYFYNKLTNLIDEAWVNPTTVQYENISRATIQGVEAEMSYPLSSTYSLVANYTYLTATNDVTNTRLYDRPRHKVAARLAYHGEDDVTANLWCELNSGYFYQTAPNVGVNKSYLLVNMNMEKPINRNLSLRFGVDNLFNKQDNDLDVQGTYIHGGIHWKF